MPALSVDKIEFLETLRKTSKGITETILENAVFDFGVELDDIYEENGRTKYKFDIPANRYDLLCFEGFLNAVSCFLSENQEHREIKYTTSASLKVIKEKTHEREYIACAIIRDINFNESSYESFISYQDKLHSSIGCHRNT